MPELQGFSGVPTELKARAGWISYMLKERQKSVFDGFVDCILLESLHNPIAGSGLIKVPPLA